MPDFIELNSLLNEKKYAEFMSELDKLYPADAAEFLASLPAAERPAVFRMLKKDTAAEIFPEFEYDDQELIISTLSDTELTHIAGGLYTDDTVDLLEEMPANVVKRVLASVSPAKRAIVNKFLAYKENTAGSIMTSEYATLKSEMLVRDAIDHIRKTGYDKETVYNLFVIDSGRHLLGSLELSDLIFGSPDEPVINLADTDTAYAFTSDNQEDAAAKIAKYDLLALPVVDSEMRLVGIITFDDAMDVLEDEATEDIVKMAAVTPAEHPYLKTSTLEFFRKRIPWLLILMVSATFTSSIIKHYEDALGLYVILTAFIPMLMDTGGNAGGQSSATVIRSLSLGSIEPKNIFSVLWKELRVSLLCGITLSAVFFLKLIFLDNVQLEVSLVVCLTLITTVIFAKLIGAALPLAAKLLKIDPAVMASPIITTIVDTLSLFVYFNFAAVLLGI